MTQEYAVSPVPTMSLVDAAPSLRAVEPASPQHLTVIDGQTSQRLGLEANAYTSARYLERERQTVFRNYWTCVGLASDLPNPGDVYPTDVAGMPIVLVRDRQQQLRAFHNICSHRGLQLVNRACNVQGNLRCPYHSWAYKLDGSLKSTPHFGGYYQDTHDGFDRSHNGLAPIRCAQWLDLVFVNLSGDAPPLAEYLQPISDRWSKYDLTQLRREPREVNLRCRANWTLAVENFSESYHLNWVHPALNSCSRMEDHFNFEVGDIHVGQGSSKYVSGCIDGRSLPTIPDLEALGQPTVAEYVTVFPNLMVGVHPDYFLVFIVNPLSSSQTQERMTFYFAGDAAMTPENEALRHLPIDLWQATNDEDIDMIERLQSGRRSPHFAGGCFSPELEEAVYRFQQMVKQAVNA